MWTITELTMIWLRGENDYTHIESLLIEIQDRVTMNNRHLAYFTTLSGVSLDVGAKELADTGKLLFWKLPSGELKSQSVMKDIL